MKKHFLLLCLCMAAVGTHAARVIDGINYELDRDALLAVVVALDYPDKYSGDITIPKTVKVGDYEFTVVGVEKRAFAGCKITSVSFPGTLRYINNEAFYNCSQLTSISLPDSITGIGAEAFAGCSKVKSLKLPDNEVTVLYNAFSYMRSLTELVIPDKWTSIGYIHSDGEEYGEQVFEECTSLRKVVIGKGVKSICQEAFSNCSELSEVVCSEEGSLEYISSKVFEYTALTSMRFLPHTLKKMRESVFMGCSMTEIFIPSSLEVYYGGQNHSADAELKSLVLEDSPNPIQCLVTDGWFTEVYLGRAISANMPFRVNRNSKNIKKVTFGPYFRGGYEWSFGYGVEEIYSQVTDPSVITCTFTDQVYDNATLYVPVGTKEAYAAQSNFKKFFDIREYEPSGINATERSYRPTVSDHYYDLNGRRTNRPQKGIYIVNGTKVVVK